MSRELLQIVPALPPSVSGVGDYALLLARELQATYGVRTRFLNGNPAWRGASSVLPFAAVTVEEQSTAALLKALEQVSSCQTVLLHYVGHGYEKRGCPLWLVRALERWKQTNRARLIVLFHEVSGTGPIWTSGFWTAGLQASLAKRLARLADRIRITTEVSARRLRAMLPASSTTPVRVLPVFSTLGEIAVPLPYQQRARQMIVFGGGGWREAAYTRHLGALQKACEAMGIETVVDIGVPVRVRPTLPVPFIEAGVLSAGAASALMSKAIAGFFTYPVLHIGKSTIFAAYCAHGMVPVTFARNALDGDEGLRAAKHFLAGFSSTPGEDDFSALAKAAHAWYQQHGLSAQAREVHELLGPGDHVPTITSTQKPTPLQP